MTDPSNISSTLGFLGRFVNALWEKDTSENLRDVLGMGSSVSNPGPPRRVVAEVVSSLYSKGSIETSDSTPKKNLVFLNFHQCLL